MQQQLLLCVPKKSQLIIFSFYFSPSFLSISFFLSKLLPSTEQTLAYAINHSYHNGSRSGRTCTFQHILHYRFKCRRSHWTSQVIYCKRFSLHAYLLVVSILELFMPTFTLRAVQPKCMIRPLHQERDVLHMVRIENRI